MLKHAEALLLLFDFDGTLVSIAPTPRSIKPHPELSTYLDALSRRYLTNVAILSGRTLEDLETYIPVTLGIALAGAHGAVIRMPGKEKTTLFGDAVILSELTYFAHMLKKSILNLPGISIEDKGISVAMHYRLSKEKDALEARRLFLFQAAQLKSFKHLQVLEGKMVLELRPKDVGKGVAVTFLCGEFLPSRKALVVYFGDDTTDIDAFKALPSGSIRVAIGKKISNLADYVLESPQELLEIIRRLPE